MDNISALSTTLALVAGACKIMSASLKKHKTVGILMPPSSGKSSLCNEMNKQFKGKRVLFIDMDSYIQTNTHTSKTAPRKPVQPQSSVLNSLKAEVSGKTERSSDGRSPYLIEEVSEAVVQTETVNDIYHFPEIKERVKELKKDFRGYKLVLVTSSRPLLDYCRIFYRHTLVPSVVDLGTTLASSVGPQKYTEMVIGLFDLMEGNNKNIMFKNWEDLYKKVEKLVR